jgi:hypothetical protein
VTATAEEVEALEGLDFPVMCEVVPQYAQHGEGEVAAWSVWSVARMPCGCLPHWAHLFMCRSCWTYFSDGRPVRCGTCQQVFLFMRAVGRVVPL